jgi:hypothetical protein
MLKYYRKYRLPKFVDLLNEIKDDDPAKDLYEPVTVIPTADWRRLAHLLNTKGENGEAEWLDISLEEQREIMAIIAKVEAGNGTSGRHTPPSLREQREMGVE